MSRAARPIFDCLVAIALLSAMDAIIKGLVSRLPVVEVAFLRYAIGSATMTAIVGVTRPGWPRLDTIRANALRAILVVVTALTFFYALGQLPLAETLILSFVSPLFTALLAVGILGERLNGRILLAIGAGFAGVLVIVLAGQEHSQSAPSGPGRPLHPVIFGVAAVLVSAFTYAASNVFLRARAQRDPPERQLQPFGLQSALDEVVIAHRRPAGCYQHVGAGIAGAPDRIAGRLDLVRHDAEVDDLGAFGAR